MIKLSEEEQRFADDLAASITTTRPHPHASAKGSARDEWCTPQWMVDLIVRVWPDGIALDPCCNAHSKVPAMEHAALGVGGWLGDGLRMGPWPERTFVNPPYSDPTPWVERCAVAPCCMALLRCDPSVRWFAYVWEADAIAFFRRRVQFDPPPGITASQNTGANVLALWNAPAAMVLRFAEVMVEAAHVIVR